MRLTDAEIEALCYAHGPHMAPEFEAERRRADEEHDTLTITIQAAVLEKLERDKLVWLHIPRDDKSPRWYTTHAGSLALLRSLKLQIQFEREVWRGVWREEVTEVVRERKRRTRGRERFSLRMDPRTAVHTLACLLDRSPAQANCAAPEVTLDNLTLLGCPVVVDVAMKPWRVETGDLP